MLCENYFINLIVNGWMIFIESWKGWEGRNILLKADKDSTTQRWKKHWWLLVTIIIMITIININNIIIWLRFVRVCVHVYIWLKMCVGREQHTECMIMPLINMYYIYIYIYLRAAFTILNRNVENLSTVTILIDFHVF